MSISEEDISANLLDFLYVLDLWLADNNLSLSDFYEWEDKRNEDLYQLWSYKGY